MKTSKSEPYFCAKLMGAFRRKDSQSCPDVTDFRDPSALHSRTLAQTCSHVETRVTFYDIWSVGVSRWRGNLHHLRTSSQVRLLNRCCWQICSAALHFAICGTQMVSFALLQQMQQRGMRMASLSEKFTANSIVSASVARRQLWVAWAEGPTRERPHVHQLWSNVHLQLPHFGV